jgi:hypothetical protein
MSEPTRSAATFAAGRAAELLASVALHAVAINATPVGKAVIHFAEGQAHLELRYSFPPLRFDL